jgi:hypothetical protein
MNTNEHDNLNQSDAPDRDVLICRVVEGRASAGDWSDLRQRVQVDPSLWADIQTSSTQSRILEGDLSHALASVERIDLPTHVTALTPALTLAGTAGAAGRSPLRRSAWMGWAVAAAMALAFAGQFVRQQSPSGASGKINGAGVAAGLGAFTSPDQALAEYMKLGEKRGSVLGEMPHQIVEARPNPDGPGYEVLYIRPVLERMIVSDVYRRGTDEAGAPNLVPTTFSEPPVGF